MPSDFATPVKIALLVLSLGLDTFTVAVALGIAGIGRRDRLRVGSTFALFEGGMPLVGFVIGRLAGQTLGDAATIAGIVVLFLVGAWMVYESVSAGEELDLEISSLRRLVVTAPIRFR